ncbi:MAG: ATP-dependent zinc protease [Pseudomonadota bacterium]
MPAPNPQPMEQLTLQLDALKAAISAQGQMQNASSTAVVSSNDAMHAEVVRLRDAMASLSAQVRNSCPTQTSPAVVQVCEPSAEYVVDEHGKLILGEIERVLLNPPGLAVVARIDSGASSSSLHATDITEFERDGEDWVRFTVNAPEGDTPLTVEREILRYVRVFQQADKVGTRRPVVAMRVAVGNIQDTFDFTLADRSHLEHGMILGRNFLRDIALVDVSRRHVQPQAQVQTTTPSGF